MKISPKSKGEHPKSSRGLVGEIIARLAARIASMFGFLGVASEHRTTNVELRTSNEALPGTASVPLASPETREPDALAPTQNTTDHPLPGSALHAPRSR